MRKAEPLPPLVLASGSPQRRKLLRAAGFSFKIVPSGVHEGDPSRVPAGRAAALVKRLAVRKARDVARRFKRQRCIVLGADTLVVCNGKILGKPGDEAHAREILGTLSGRWQKVMTGVCLISNPGGKMRVGHAETGLRFKKLDEPTIARLAKKNRDKSGAYAIQKMNDRYVRVLRGDLDNVIGLPVKLVRRLLRKFPAGLS